MPKNKNRASTEGEVLEAHRFYYHIQFLEHQKIWRQIGDLLSGYKDCITRPEYLFFHPSEQVERQCDERDKEWAREDRHLREERTQYVNLSLIHI